MRPTDGGARRFNFLVAQGRAVRCSGVGLGGGALGDHGLAADERGPVLVTLGSTNGLIHRVHIMTIHRLDHLPTIGFKPFWDIVRIPITDM